ncbi:MAG: hypothetical protein AB8B56_15585 [Crocinitomicaceae bacterium]
MIAQLKFISVLVKHFNYSHTALAIMAILTISCESNQAEIAAKTKALEAQQELKMVHNLEYAHFLQFSAYSSDLEELNYPPHKLVTQGGTALYEISIVEASPTGFKAKAQAVQDFDGDGKFSIWEIDEEGRIKEVQTD